MLSIGLVRIVGTELANIPELWGSTPSMGEGIVYSLKNSSEKEISKIKTECQHAEIWDNLVSPIDEVTMFYMNILHHLTLSLIAIRLVNLLFIKKEIIVTNCSCRHD